MGLTARVLRCCLICHKQYSEFVVIGYVSIVVLNFNLI